MITAKALVTLVSFIISVIFVIRPIYIPLWPGKHIRFSLNLSTTPPLAIVVLWASGCINGAVIRDGIVGTDGVKPYNILILFFALAYMAITVDVTGLLQSAAFWVSNKGGSSGWKLYFYFYAMLTLLSIVLGNDPVILSGTAFLVYYTKVAELDPIAWLISEFAAANTASMVLFVGNPTNVVICEGFAINNASFTLYTILPFMGCVTACFIALAVQFRREQYIPKRLALQRDLDPRSVLLDPVSAVVGSALLITCLVVIIASSFFHVDVWKISLPFAVVKFIFDSGWDHYRHLKSQRAPAEIELQPIAKQDTPQMPTAPSFFKDRISILRSRMIHVHTRLHRHFPTFFTTLPRLPFALVPFAFTQFILIEALAHQGWIDLFALWLHRATRGGSVFPTIWVVGVLGVVLCNIAGTNIGATILLTKITVSSHIPSSSQKAAAIALAVASNIGAVGATFSASLAGLLWRDILRQKGIVIRQRTFAFWNAVPVMAMTGVGLAVVSAEMAVLRKTGQGI